MKTICLTILLSVLFVSPAFAQDQSSCSDLLRHGIYDKFRENSVSASASALNTHICQAYQQYLSDKQGGHVQANYGLLGGEGSYSAEKIAAVGQFMCADTAASSSASTGLTVASDVISQPALDAYRECLNLSAGGLKTNTVFREADQGQVTLEVRYVAPVGAPPQTTVNKVVLSPTDAFNCTGPLWDAQGHANAVGTQAVAMSCDRKIAAVPFNFNNQSVLAGPNTIVVLTTSGTITRSLGPILAAPPATPLKIPTGTIIPFSGTMADAISQREFGWWVCDGTVVDDPVADPAFKQKPTPMLSGIFLMASNQAGQTGGKTAHHVPDQTINSHTTGGFGPPIIHGDPFTHMQGSHTWTDDASIYSSGVWSGVDVPTMPPFYTVIYLIKVK